MQQHTLISDKKRNLRQHVQDFNERAPKYGTSFNLKEKEESLKVRTSDRWNLAQNPWKQARYSEIGADPHVTMWAGYLENVRDPWALNYAPLFWRSEAGDQLPFNDETYNAFNQVMNQKFINGEIPGVIRYDQPSKEEIKTILQNSGAYAIDYAHTPAAHRPSKIPKQDKRGPPGLQAKNPNIHG